MTLPEIETLVNEVLRDILGATGFVHADVEPYVDHAGDKALRVVAHFGPGTAPSAERPTVRAMGALRGALLDRDEERFPYLDYAFPDDRVIADDEP
ncbi:hypothetical protein [Methylobacterium isbiliense]|jgi:hypothetical protein|uniref:Ribosome maturation factor RimP n=1 Tax=Methylobacterium isbiliense TaxID=315478 RepID=A0ABQ4SD80_9HYPH|nr:hypothetical protein [Methylobacterium isbiliense]MDN3625141.1 hypothetical protein [Methylobacterium isbiliense]GJE00445.1 hypothetical protein GMJLKIPL_2367 [Methylobacterium isbiliense]